MTGNKTRWVIVVGREPAEPTSLIGRYSPAEFTPAGNLVPKIVSLTKAMELSEVGQVKRK